MKFSEVLISVCLMAVLAVTLAAVSKPSQNAGGAVVLSEDNDLNMPSCRSIYIGGCKHIWCRRGHGAGLGSADPTCRPTNATVSDRPLTP